MVLCLQVETTVVYGTFRVLGTVVGCMLGFGYMYSVDTVGSPVLVSYADTHTHKYTA